MSEPVPPELAADRQRMGPRLIRFGLRFGGLVGSLWLLSIFVDLREPVIALGRLPWLYAAAVLAMATLRAAMTATRWWWLTPKGSGLTLWSCFRLLMIGSALGLFLPGVVGGDLGRSVFLLKEVRDERGGALVSMFADRIVGLVSVLMLGLSACLLTELIDHRLVYAGLFAAMLGLILAFAWASVHPRALQAVSAMAGRLGTFGDKIQGPMASMARALAAYRDQPLRVLAVLLFCVPIHLLSFSLVWVGARGLGIHIDLLSVAAVLSIVWVITMLPISIGGLGLRELSFVFLLAGSGVSEAQAGSLALLVSAVIVLFAVAGVPLIWLGGPREATVAPAHGPTAHDSAAADGRAMPDEGSP